MTKGGTNATKDVIYIDVDDEITAIIDKVRGSGKKIVALVLPKRATMLQSVVNMKLLKRAAHEAKKNLVLITSEAGLMPLAGNVGLHVAKSLNSKPEVPEAPGRVDDTPETVEETGGPDDEAAEDQDEQVDKRKTVGELAGASATAAAADDADETIELDDEEAGPDSTADDKSAKGKKKKFKIPNFNKFRLILILSVVGLILLSGFGYAALAVMPKAKVTIKTDSTAVNSSVVITLKTATDTKLDEEKAVMPAQPQQVKKTVTQEVPATGQLNNGQKATGSVVMSGKDCTGPSYTPPADVAMGSGINSGGNTYITKEKAEFGAAGFSGGCLNYESDSIDIVAQTGGAKFNVTSASFTVRSDVTATGSASGGTDNIVKVVTQGDIDSAKQKIGEQDNEPIQQELKSALIGRGLFVIDETFSVGAAETKSNIAAGAPGDTVIVTQEITYTLLGVKREELEKIIARTVEDKIDTKKQTILSHGLDDAVFGLQSATPEATQVNVQATVVAGAELNTASLKKQIAGKKAAEAKKIIEANPGVTSVTVEYSPFWVSSIPKKVDKITITVQEPKVTADDASAAP